VGWLSGWGVKRLQLTIDNTKVDSSLSDFPVMVKLSTASGIGDVDVSSVFDELTADANRKKIAVTTSNGTTQCYVEIEKWDDANETAVLWVKVPTVSDSSDTVLYLYYDSSHADNDTYVGDTGDAVAQNVWDANFVAVWHLAEDPSTGGACMLDSTSNGNDGTPAGTMTSGDLVAGQCGDCVDLDGSDDYINVGTDSSLEVGATNLTVQAIAAWTGANTGDGIVCMGACSDGNDYGLTTGYSGSAATKMGFIYGGNNWCFDAGSGLNDGVFRHFVGRRASASTNTIFINGSSESFSTGGANCGTYNAIGEGHGGALLAGKVDEVRVSDSARSDAWVKADYNSCFDSLITFAASNWLSTDYDSRFPIDIDSDKVDSSLSNFPVLIKLSTSSGIDSDDVSAVFDELTSDANRFKIAVTTSDGSTQCYVEIEKWDDANEEALLWVKVPSVSDSADTRLYLYYDADADDNVSYVSETAQHTPSDGLKLEPDTSDYTGTTLTTGITALYNDVYNANVSGAWMQHYSYGLDFGSAKTVDTVIVYVRNAAGTACGTSYYGSGYDSVQVLSSDDNTTWTDEETFNAPPLTSMSYGGYMTLSLASSFSARYVKVVALDANIADGAGSTFRVTEMKAFNRAPVEAVWDSNFVVVYHLNEDTSSGDTLFFDSTSNKNNAIPGGTITQETGQLDKAIGLDTADGARRAQSKANLGISGSDNRTYEAVAAADSPVDYAIVLCSGTNSTDAAFSLDNGTSGKARISTVGNQRVFTCDMEADSNFHHYAAVLSGTTQSDLALYQDGTSQGVDSTSGSAINTTDGPIYIGSQSWSSYDYRWDGVIDEVRISDMARAAEWNKATYYTIFDSFLTFGSLEELAESATGLDSLDNVELSTEVGSLILGVAHTLSFGSISVEGSISASSFLIIRGVNPANVSLETFCREIGLTIFEITGRLRIAAVPTVPSITVSASQPHAVVANSVPSITVEVE